MRANADDPVARLAEFEKEVERQRKRLRGRPGIRPATAGIAILFAASLSLMGGMAFAQVLTSDSVTQEASSYSASSAASPTFPNAPSLALGSVPSGVSGCTTTSVAYPAGTPTNWQQSVYLGAGSSCASGHVAEVWSFTSPTTLPESETVRVAVSTEVGSSTYYTLYANLTVTAGTYPVAPTLLLYVDYGPVVPAAGVTTLSLILS